MPSTDAPPLVVQSVKSPVSNPGLLMRFALAGQATERAASAVKASRILGKAFMPRLWDGTVTSGVWFFIFIVELDIN